jgi:CheY-like chemotaxis protein
LPGERTASKKGVVLLVDDEELVRATTADMLIDVGYEVVQAGSGDEALNQVAAGVRSDLLVTDHLMPGQNGPDLAAALRKTWPELLVLIISGYAENAGIPVDLPRLTKLFRQAELLESLTRLS